MLSQNYNCFVWFWGSTRKSSWCEFWISEEVLKGKEEVCLDVIRDKWTRRFLSWGVFGQTVSSKTARSSMHPMVLSRLENMWSRQLRAFLLPGQSTGLITVQNSHNLPEEHRPYQIVWRRLIWKLLTWDSLPNLGWHINYNIQLMGKVRAWTWTVFHKAQAD